MPCWGKWYLMIRRITASPARSASVTGSKFVFVLLSSIDSEVRKNGRMTSPDEVARRPMKAEKSMTVTSVPLIRKLLSKPVCEPGADAWRRGRGILDVLSYFNPAQFARRSLRGGWHIEY